jgi:tetratricopeptide (TPR) repeat protein
MKQIILSICLIASATLTQAQTADVYQATIEQCRDQSTSFESRLAACNSALPFDDPTEEALQGRAFVYMQMGRHAEALKDFNDAIARTEHVKNGEIWAGTHWALWNRAVFYIDRGEVELAMLDIERVLTEAGVPSIKSVQNDMLRLGTFAGEADGNYDARTKSAIEQCLRDPACHENW